MNAFICVNYPIDHKEIGISKKIESQIEAIERAGYQVTFSAYTDKGIGIYKNNKEIALYPYPRHINKRIINTIRRFLWLKAVKSFLQLRKEKYDLAFIRWGAIDKLFISTLISIKDKSRFILMDCHGYHKNYKGRNIKSKYIELTTKKNSNKLRLYIDECLTETKCTEIFGIPAIPMDTCIDVDKYEKHFYQGTNREIHMISVANETPYHGYDRIIRALQATSHSNVYLHLVGKMSEKTIAMATDASIKDHIYLYGSLSGKKLIDVYNKCNLGVGPLAPHRIGGKEGTGIKTKEYFAIGLPYFYAGNELLVPDNYPYVLKLQDDDEPVDIDKIITFYTSLPSEDIITEDMRQFARMHYSWDDVFHKAIQDILNR